MMPSMVDGSKGVILICRGSGVEIVAMFLSGCFEPHASACTPSTIAGDALPVLNPANCALSASKLLEILLVASLRTSDTVSMIIRYSCYLVLNLLYYNK